MTIDRSVVIAFGVFALASVGLLATFATKINKKKSKGSHLQRKLTTPRQDGFYMPAEWDVHERCWMIWPVRPDNWRENATLSQKAFTEVANTIARFEPVTMCVPTNEWEKARSVLSPGVSVVEMSSDDAWARDSAPTFVVAKTLKGGQEVRGVNWQFNAYGGEKYGLFYPSPMDELLATKMINVAQKLQYDCDMVLEGGSIHVDGEGTALTTEECLLHPGRNPHLTRSQIEDRLKEYLNVQKVIWLKRGLFADHDTNGHIDNICCFIHPAEVVLAWTDDKNDPQYEISVEALQILSSTTDAKGRQIRVHKLHQPDPMYYTEEDIRTLQPCRGKVIRSAGERMAGSYINFYIANGGIIVPKFGDKVHDQMAADKLKELFPDRQVVSVSSKEILLGGGNIHCITQQQPVTIV